MSRTTTRTTTRTRIAPGGITSGTGRPITSGRALHLRGVSREAFEDALALLGVRAALLAEVSAWLSFIPVGKVELDALALGRALEAPLLEVRRGSGPGARVTWYEPGGIRGVLHFGGQSAAVETASADEIEGNEGPLLLERLCHAGLLDASGRPLLASLLAGGCSRGPEPEHVRLLSVVFRFPFCGVVPVTQSGNANARDVLDRVDDAVLLPCGRQHAQVLRVPVLRQRSGRPGYAPGWPGSVSRS